METKIESPQYKTAYYVRSWGTKIEKGVAFTITYSDYGTTTKGFFIKDGCELPSIVDAKQVVYSKKEADELLAKESKSYREYYERQLKEAQEKIAALNKAQGR